MTYIVLKAPLNSNQPGSEFPAICNHWRVMASWSRKTSKFCEQFFAFLGKTTPYSKIFKNIFQVFTASLIDVVVFKFREICPTENRWNMRYLVIYLTKKFRLPLKCVATPRIAPKIWQGQPPIVSINQSSFNKAWHNASHCNIE